jgi:centromeric protein E
MSNFKL